MIELGKMQKLIAVKENQLGMFLNLEKDSNENDILLPQKHVPQGLKINDEIEVFIYPADESKMIATTTKPKLMLGELAVLKVVDTTTFGAFLDWGLDKDLLLPFKEQISHVTKGKTYLVGLFLNHINRLCATMKIYDLLDINPPYKANDRVQGTVYNINPDLGVFVAVDNQYHGLILNKELYGNYNIGDNIQVRIKKVREDGKLELSLREEAHNEIESDARTILERLKSNNGTFPLNDNSPPEQIRARLGMSKRAFKRAVGRLLKEGAIKITDEGIELTWQ